MMDCNLDELMPHVEQMVESGDDIEEVIAFLRRQGCSKLACVKAVYRVKAVSLRDAQRIVHYSPAWEATKEADEKLQNNFIEALIVSAQGTGDQITIRDSEQESTNGEA